MKKPTIALTLVLGLAVSTFAQGGSMFHRENSGDNGKTLYEGKGNRINGDTPMPSLPFHNQTSNQDAPINSGIALMTAFGAAYLIGKRRYKKNNSQNTL